MVKWRVKRKKMFRQKRQHVQHLDGTKRPMCLENTSEATKNQAVGEIRWRNK